MPPSPIIRSAISQFRRYKGLAESAVAQIPEPALFEVLDEESNSIAMLLKHLAGNLLSRWTNFLTSDGDKPDRDRDAEFLTDPSDTKEKLLAHWEAGWGCAFAALEALRPEDLERTVTIRGEPCTVLEAIHRNLTHTAYHVGQIVLLAKHSARSQWQTLSIPRGKSKEATTAPGRPGARSYWKR
ncbi:MAG: hypothetical protein HW398_694 [Acidobacteria bacterium]|nr:hypothetical protein [Acidobacteriota bacterium]